MEKSVKTYLVDSFTDERFKGNPAAVCLLKKQLTNEQMQKIAFELGFSETAFVQRISKPNKYRIRFFSPVMEIPLCGHATLASAKVVFQEKEKLKDIHFINSEDLDLYITRTDDAIQMTFPVYETVDADAPTPLLKALGLDQISNSTFNKETNILILEIEDSSILRSLTPNFAALKASIDSINGVLVTAKSDAENYDFESRYFWPWSGTNEDPVTGATHTFLAKYWQERLGKTKMNSFQCSKRSGHMQVEIIDDQKLVISSNAQIVFKGKLYF